jgi:hypothetical protein
MLESRCERQNRWFGHGPFVNVRVLNARTAEATLASSDLRMRQIPQEIRHSLRTILAALDFDQAMRATMRLED